MTDQIQKIVTELPDLEDITGVWAVARGWVAQGDAAQVADLGIAVAGAYGSEGRTWQYSVVDHLLRLLATSAGPENVTQALRLVSSVEVASRKRDRCTASLLASTHEERDLAAAFTGHASEELRACLVHELVLRGVVVEETAGIAGWAMSPHWNHHPLGWLPLTLSELERGVDLPSRELAMIVGARVPPMAEVTTQAAATAIATAVANWADESNGRIEARVFDLVTPVEAASVPAVLLALGLECLHGVGRRAAMSVTVRPPAHAWRVLFAAASSGGAYNSGSYGAYGRLATWQSLAALAGCPEGANTHEIEAHVRDCTWHSFDADTKWFEQVAWDIGLAVLAPGRQRLAVLAATDTD